MTHEELLKAYTELMAAYVRLAESTGIVYPAPYYPHWVAPPWNGWPIVTYATAAAAPGLPYINTGCQPTAANIQILELTS